MKKEATVHIFNYIGSKARMACVLSSLIPDHCTTYAELYCGSGALALNSRKFEVKILNDLNPHMVNFWRVATDPNTREKLFKKLQATHYNWSEFRAAKQRQWEHGSKQADKLQWAVDTFVLNRQSFNGAGSNWVYKDREQYSNLLTNPLRLPLAVKMLKGQTFRVHNDNALAVMDKEKLLDNPHAFLFLDPPYLEGLRSKGKLYLLTWQTRASILAYFARFGMHKPRSYYQVTGQGSMMGGTCTIITCFRMAGTGTCWANTPRGVRWQRRNQLGQSGSGATMI